MEKTSTPERSPVVGLVELVAEVPASEVGKVIAAWMHRNLPPDDIAARQRTSRSVKWRTEPDGMVVFTLRLQPHIAAILISLLSVLVMRSKARREADGTYPSTTAQYTDAIEEILDADAKPINASARQRHPTARQRRVVKERDRNCVDCGRHDPGEYDHVPEHETTRRTHLDELQLRCAPCHHRRHHPPAT